MFKLWPWWLTLFMLFLTLGVFWLLGQNVEFSRTGSPANAAAKPTAAAAK